MSLRGAVSKPSGARPRALSAHQAALRARLDGAEFRMLNEALYTRTGSAALELLQSDARLFSAYHAGFARQAARWPENPLDRVLRALADLPATAVVADMGCGEARLSAEARQATVHSFDLVAANERVVACDIADLPLEHASVDVAVFCLALMGTDYPKFLKEARRVLKPGGTLLVAEVASRFEDADPEPFAKGVAALGFKLCADHPFARAKVSGKRAKRRKKAKAKAKAADGDGENKRVATDFFFYFAFEREENLSPGHEAGKQRKGKEKERANAKLPPLKPCIYKRR